jgi:hypothetical protein
MGISLLIFQYPNEGLHKVSLLQQVTSAQALIPESIDESHGVLEDASIPLEE